MNIRALDFIWHQTCIQTVDNLLTPKWYCFVDRDKTEAQICIVGIIYPRKCGIKFNCFYSIKSVFDFPWNRRKKNETCKWFIIYLIDVCLKKTMNATKISHGYAKRIARLHSSLSKATLKLKVIIFMLFKAIWFQYTKKTQQSVCVYAILCRM